MMRVPLPQHFSIHFLLRHLRSGMEFISLHIVYGLIPRTNDEQKHPMGGVVASIYNRHSCSLYVIYNISS